MAKLEKQVEGKFTEILEKLDNAIMEGSISASLEDGSEYHKDGLDFAVRVYERYSMMGGNRLSLTLSLVGSEGQYFLSAITAGGSQAILHKINTWGEEAFLDSIREVIGYL